MERVQSSPTENIYRSFTYLLDSPQEIQVVQEVANSVACQVSEHYEFVTVFPPGFCDFAVVPSYNSSLLGLKYLTRDVMSGPAIGLPKAYFARCPNPMQEDWAVPTGVGTHSMAAQPPRTIRKPKNVSNEVGSSDYGDSESDGPSVYEDEPLGVIQKHAPKYDKFIGFDTFGDWQDRLEWVMQFCVRNIKVGDPAVCYNKRMKAMQKVCDVVRRGSHIVIKHWEGRKFDTKRSIISLDGGHHFGFAR